VLPQTIEEMRAEEENVQLRQNERVDVTPQDDHATHLEIHNRMEDTPAKYAHMQAHKRAMLLQRVRPDLFPPEPSQMQGEMTDKALPNPARETTSKSRPMPTA
jgi:hypothetical protein